MKNNFFENCGVVERMKQGLHIKETHGRKGMYYIPVCFYFPSWLARETFTAAFCSSGDVKKNDFFENN